MGSQRVRLGPATLSGGAKRGPQILKIRHDYGSHAISAMDPFSAKPWVVFSLQKKEDSPEAMLGKDSYFKWEKVSLCHVP